MPLLTGPISYAQAIILGLLQGFSELFPISSLGHSVILPQLLGWDIHQNDEYFITFLIATHLATAIVLFLFFFRDWMRIFAGMWDHWQSDRSPRTTPTRNSAGCWWWAPIPAGLLGLLFQDALRERLCLRPIRRLLPHPNGVMLYGAERLRRRAPVVIGQMSRKHPIKGSPVNELRPTPSPSAPPRRSR